MKRTSPSPVKFSPETAREIEAVVFALAEKALPEAGAGLYLLDVRFEKEAGAWFLRVTLEKTGTGEPETGASGTGVSLSDCEAVSRLLDPLLDTHAPFLALLGDTAYSLEVSSPGLFRPLRKPRELAFYIGRPVRAESRPGKRKKPGLQVIAKPREGILLSFDETRQAVTLKEPDSEDTFEVTLDESLTLSLNPAVHFPEEDDPR